MAFGCFSSKSINMDLFHVKLLKLKIFFFKFEQMLMKLPRKRSRIF